MDNLEDLLAMGKFLEEHDKKEWATMIYEFIDIMNDEPEDDDDSDYDYSEDEGDAVPEPTYTTEDEQGFLSLA